MPLERLKLHLPGLHPVQQTIMESPARFKVVAAGRRFGKSRLGVSKCLRVASGDRWWSDLDTPGRTWWVPPIYKQGLVAWRQLAHVARRIPGCEIHKGEQSITLPNGGSVTIRTGDNPDSLRSEGLDFVVLDEAAFLKEEVWSEALRPSLSDRRGGALFISTPKGYNWFYDRWLRAADLDGWQRWQHPTADNPYIHPDEIEAARLELGSLAFAQEYLAEFVEAGGTLFHPQDFRYYLPATGHHVRLHDDAGRQITLDMREGQRFCTVDLAASLKESADYTVVASFLYQKPWLLLLDLVRGRMEGPAIIPTIRAAMVRNGLGVAYIERAGFQLSLIQEARRQGLAVKELTADKDKLARALPLQARMEAHHVWFPKDAAWLEPLERELMAFSGLQTEHDDQVDVLAYAAKVAGDLSTADIDLSGWSNTLTRTSPNKPT